MNRSADITPPGSFPYLIKRIAELLDRWIASTPDAFEELGYSVHLSVPPTAITVFPIFRNSGSAGHGLFYSCAVLIHQLEAWLVLMTGRKTCLV